MNIVGYKTENSEAVYYHEMEDFFEGELNETFEEFHLGGLSYQAGRILREIDPIAFRQELLGRIDDMIDEGELVETLDE